MIKDFLYWLGLVYQVSLDRTRTGYEDKIENLTLNPSCPSSPSFRPGPRARSGGKIGNGTRVYGIKGKVSPGLNHERDHTDKVLELPR